MSVLRAVARWFVVGIVLASGRARRRSREPDTRPVPSPRAELLVLALLGLCSLGSAAFVLVYFTGANTQLLGLALGGALAALAGAAGIASRYLVPQDKRVEPWHAYGDERAQEEVVETLEQGGDRLSRRRLLKVAAGGAGAAVAGALVVPAASLGPGAQHALTGSPWRRGRRLVDERGRPLTADSVAVGSFQTAFPQGADRDRLASPVVVVRISTEELRLPAERHGWAPRGILAFSKICTHAGCAISLFRYPLYDPTSPGPALVCPCHYSTFDVTRGGDRVFGPAARGLPQLPLAIARDGTLVAAGDFSGRVGPAWWAVRK